MMTDEQLAKFMGIHGKVGCAEILATVTPEKRAVYERMAEVEMDVEIWQLGLGPKPHGVLIDLDRRTPPQERTDNG
jgi:hypothetical protein